MPITVTIKGELEIAIEQLRPDVLGQIKVALSVVNEDRLTQQREKIAGWWDLPEHIELWREEHRRGGDHVLVMPRGFAMKLRQGLQAMGEEVEWDDQRSLVPAEPSYYRPFLVRPYQAPAIADMLRSEQGILEAPAGSGKTITMLGLVALASQRTLVIVDKVDLALQWIERAQEFLGIEADDIGLIGQDVWREADLTLALRQTLWSREKDLTAAGWFKGWGMVIADETHHVAADSLSQICARIPAHYFLGCSATPAKSETKGKIVESIVGPIVHRITRAELREYGVLVMPTVERVETSFETDFWPTHDSDPNGDCQMAGCKKTGQHGHRNNYSKALKMLVEDEARNRMIAGRIAAERGHVHLVPSRQLKHLDILCKAVVEAGWPEDKVFMLRGEENAAKVSREIVAAIKESDEAVVFSTVADEALDVPPIDREHLVFPMRQEAAVTQLVGRAERVWPGKEDARIYDYVDRTDVFYDQATARMGAYRRNGYPITGYGFDDKAEAPDAPVASSSESDETPAVPDPTPGTIVIPDGRAWYRGASRNVTYLRKLFDEDQEAVEFSDQNHPFSSFCDLWPLVVSQRHRPSVRIFAPTREHLFQAWKTTTDEAFEHVLGLDERHGNLDDEPYSHVATVTPAEAKHRGRRTKLREDWDFVSFDVMTSWIHSQVAHHENLRFLLENTGMSEIVQTRPDPIWGVGPDGQGRNKLGEAWMKVRMEVREHVRKVA